MGNKSGKHPYKYKETKDLLGVGAFGKTYKAAKTKGDQESVAIHLVYKDQSFQDASVIMNSAGSIIRVSNFCQNLISTVDFYEDKLAYYIVMEYCSRQDLSRYLIDVKPFFVSRLDIMVQAARGVHFLHSQIPPILHGHLKPQNILIHTEGYKDIVKVTDYGFPIALPTCASFSKFMLQKDRCLFCPPEYFMPSGIFSPGVDIFSLGLVFYVTITHKGNAIDNCPRTG